MFTPNFFTLLVIGFFVLYFTGTTVFFGLSFRKSRGFEGGHAAFEFRFGFEPQLLGSARRALFAPFFAELGSKG